MPTTPTYIVNDQPTDRDALDFTPYIQQPQPELLSRVSLASCNSLTPMVKAYLARPN